MIKAAHLSHPSCLSDFPKAKKISIALYNINSLFFLILAYCIEMGVITSADESVANVATGAFAWAPFLSCSSINC